MAQLPGPLLCVIAAAYIPGGCYDYLTLSGKLHVERLSRGWTDRNVLSHIQVTLPVPVSPARPYESVTVRQQLRVSAERERGGPRSQDHQQCSGGRRCRGNRSRGATLPPKGQQLTAGGKRTLLFHNQNDQGQHLKNNNPFMLLWFQR